MRPFVGHCKIDFLDTYSSVDDRRTVQPKKRLVQSRCLAEALEVLSGARESSNDDV